MTKKIRLITNKYCDTEHAGFNCPYLVLMNARQESPWICRMFGEEGEHITLDYVHHFGRARRLKQCIKAKFNAWVEMEK